MGDQLVIAGRAFNSRLIVGTGKYRSFDEMRRAHQASGAEMVTAKIFSFCRIRQAATPRTKPCAQRGWGAKSVFQSGSSWR
jgi:thiazole synthase ThiGH ThiG subunit